MTLIKKGKESTKVPSKSYMISWYPMGDLARKVLSNPLDVKCSRIPHGTPMSVKLGLLVKATVCVKQGKLTNPLEERDSPDLSAS